MKFKSFKIGDSEVLDWYVSRDQFKECFFFEKFWLNSVISQNLPIEGIIEDSYKDFSASSSFHLGGDLASIISLGGAYESTKASGKEIMKIAQLVSDELVDGFYEDISVFINHSAWCKYFHDVAWDKTIVVLNKRERLVHVMMATDTD